MWCEIKKINSNFVENYFFMCYHNNSETLLRRIIKMADKMDNVEEVSKKRNFSASKLGIRIMAAFLALLMVLSVTATAISLIVAK